ncbi:MAG: ABC transporter substrate-binding protein [Bacillota bacterium]
MLNFKFKNYLIIILTILLVTGSFIYYSPVKAETERAKTIKIQTPPVAAAVPFFWLQEQQDVLDQLGIDLDIKVSSDHQRGLSLIQKNDIDLLITGSNVGAKAYNRGIDLKLLNINVWGIDYLLTDGFKAESWSDLEGKTLSLPLQGGPLDFLTRYLLKENGVDPETVEFVYRPSANGAKTFMAGDLDAIVLPEPMATVTLAKREEAHLSLDIQQEWAQFNQEDDRIPFVGLFAAGDFINDNSEYADLINGLYKLGIKWLNDNNQEAAELADQFMDVSPQVIEKSFTRTDLAYYDKTETRDLVEVYFKEIEKMYPDMIGGNLPDAGFYY